MQCAGARWEARPTYENMYRAKLELIVPLRRGEMVEPDPRYNLVHYLNPRQQHRRRDEVAKLQEGWAAFGTAEVGGSVGPASGGGGGEFEYTRDMAGCELHYRRFNRAARRGYTNTNATAGATTGLLASGRTAAASPPMVGFCRGTEDYTPCSPRRTAGSVQGIPTLAACVQYCELCTQCNFVSFSREYNDCSWYAHCAFPLQTSFAGKPRAYLTVAVLAGTAPGPGSTGGGGEGGGGGASAATTSDSWMPRPEDGDGETTADAPLGRVEARATGEREMEERRES